MWVNKYSPQRLSEVVNQEKAKNLILEWFNKWRPRDRPLLLYGPPGTGKTCIIDALAKDKNYSLIQMNASDVRSASRIKNVIGKSMTQQSLLRRGKIFLLDEIEGLHGRKDFGGVKEIINVIKGSYHKIVLTCNNPYDPKLRSLRKYCTLVQFGKISVRDTEKRLKQICDVEKIKTDKEVLRELAKRAKGDLRSAINDLESISRGRKSIRAKDLEMLAYRERETSIFDALKIILKTKSALAARLSISNVDKDPDEIFWWIENNIAREYEDPEEIARAFDALSKADIFRQRIRSRQNWRFKAYMIDMMTAGVALAKKEMYHKFTRYQYPSKLIVLGRTKWARKEEMERLKELSKELHCSTKKIRTEFLPFINIMKTKSGQ